MSAISSLLRREGHRRRHGRSTCAKDVNQYGARIEATKTCSVDDAGEDLFGSRRRAGSDCHTTRRPIEKVFALGSSTEIVA